MRDHSEEKIEEIRQLVSQEKGGEGDVWDVLLVETARIPFLDFPCWIVTSSQKETRRVVRDLVVEKDWQFHLFDVTDILTLDDRLSVNDEVRGELV